jgi:DNA-binding NarL/FixJ family response regulator
MNVNLIKINKFAIKQWRVFVRKSLLKLNSLMKSPLYTTPMPKVMLVENDRTLLTMLANSLAQFGQNITAIANNSSDAIKLFQKVNPEVVILDIDLGDSIDGIELANLMQKSNPNIGIVFLTSFNDHRFAFISKKEIPKNYIYLRKQEISNVKMVSDAILEAVTIARKYSHTRPVAKTYYSEFSDRDIELMRHISKGYSNIKIAKILKIEQKSCENAISRLLKKLNIPPDKEVNQRVRITQKYFELSGKEVI